MERKHCVFLLGTRLLFGPFPSQRVGVKFQILFENIGAPNAGFSVWFLRVSKRRRTSGDRAGMVQGSESDRILRPAASDPTRGDRSRPRKCSNCRLISTNGPNGQKIYVIHRYLTCVLTELIKDDSGE